ncbi:MAG: Crp/Fnr family transcriptional regulator [Desulfoplanes sp.]|nr:Crp/Fnr family transcriptional regulator [Desulfoplanes sp.]
MNTQHIMDILKRVDLFDGLSDAYLEALGGIARHMSLDKGQTVFFAGDAGNGFYLVRSGRVKIFKSSFSGKEHILHVFGFGEAFGEVAVFAGDKFPASAMTLAASELLFFPRKAFLELLAKEPELALQMLALLSKRLRSFVNKVEELSLKEVPARLAGHFLLLAASGNTSTFHLDLSKTELSKYLGTIPETLSRVLKKMDDQGLIHGNGAEIEIIDMQGLEELAEGVSKL